MREIKYGAIPTLFDGVQYRSKLEARVACMLKNYGYQFDYESIELHNYLPDFIVEFAFGPTLLECKPAVLATEFKQPCRKITRSGWAGPSMVIGSQLCLGPDKGPDLTLFGSLAAEHGGWSRVGRERWPAAWGNYPFPYAGPAWIDAGNQVQWRSPVA